MPTTAKRRTTPRIVTFVALVTLGTNLTGCAHLATFYQSVLIRCQTKHDLADIRQDTRQELAQQQQELQRVEAQRAVEQARIDAQRRRLEAEFCIANQEQQQRQVQEQLRESVESKIAFNVQQALEVGELEVDTEALKLLLEKREQEQRQPPTQNQEQPCPCCDKPCDCGSGFLRRFCPHCRHKACECEHKCGGPRTYAQLQEQPQKQPLRPAEIPMKLPVRLSFGFQQPQMQEARIRRLPPPITQEQNIPCDKPVGLCPNTGNCPNGFCPVPPPGKGPTTGPAVPMPPQPAPELPTGLPPMPVPDAEAYYRSPPPARAIGPANQQPANDVKVKLGGPPIEPSRVTSLPWHYPDGSLHP